MTNQGWECPRCHSCYSPTTAQCWICNTSYDNRTGAQGLAIGGEMLSSNVKISIGPNGPTEEMTSESFKASK